MTLTIFTPTYNRKEFLKGLFESIAYSYDQCEDTDSIEWLIVDDGSKLDIEVEVSQFYQESRFPIVLIKKTNGGKHTAFNIAIKESNSDLFVCIDDDDRLTSNALRDIFCMAKKYKDSKYVGFVGRVVDEKGVLLGKTLPTPFESNTIAIRDEYSYWGEPEIYLTKELKKYSFLEISGERFLTEAYIFDVMSKGNRFVYENVPLMVKKFYPGGLTDNQLKIRIESPKGSYLYYKQRLSLCERLLSRIKTRLNMIRFYFWITDADFKNQNRLSFSDRLFCPLSFMMHFIDKLHYKRLIGR